MAALATQAALLAAGAVINDTWYSGDIQHRSKKVDITLPSGYGGATNTLAAACFGMTFIEDASAARISSSNKIFLAGPAFDGSKLFIYDITNATDASRNTPADTTAATRLIVIGKD